MDENLQNNGSTQAEDESTEYFIFTVDQINYGVEIEYINEIITMQTIAVIPNSEDYLKGIINIRGSIVPVVDFRLRFGFPPAEYHERTCIIVLTIDETNIGIVVDSVKDVLKLSPDELLQPPVNDANALHQYTKKISQHNGEVQQLLDIRLVFDTAIVE